MFFALKKLEKMTSQKRMEKGAILLLQMEKEIFAGRASSSSYLKQVLNLVASDISRERKDTFLAQADMLPDSPAAGDIQKLESLRHILLTETGREPSEWDLNCFSFDATERKAREILPVNVYLDNLRSPFNVGSVFRTAESFCYENIFISENTPTPHHPRAVRSAMGTVDSVSWKICSIDLLPRPLFALETGGIPAEEFNFPESGTVIIGSEETGISPEAVRSVNESLGIVTIPLYGLKGSINVSAAFGIISYCWINSIKSRQNRS